MADKEALKKNSFWLLFIVIGLGLAIAWYSLILDIPGKVAKAGDEVNTVRKSYQSVKAQPRKTLEAYDAQKDQLTVNRTQKWEQMWNIQSELFAWPESLGEDQTAVVKNHRFGAEINSDSFIVNFRDQYLKSYENMAKSILPMQLGSANTWQTVVRHVAETGWRRKPESEEIWLAVEDYWIQKELIESVAKVNRDAAQLTLVDPSASQDPRLRNRTAGNPRKRAFANRNWLLDLRIEDVPGGTALKGSILNMTPRLQPYNAGNQLVFKVWLNADKSSRPFILTVEGSSLEGNKEEVFKYVEAKHKIFDQNPEGIFHVEQEFDIRTAPVKRIDNIGLGYPSDKHALYALDMAAFSKKASEAEAAAAGGAGMTPAPTPGGDSAGMGMGGMGRAAVSTDRTFNGLVRKRYLSITDQVRAMPAALVVVADQNVISEVHEALANCRLRFQIVQAHSNRFRGALTLNSGLDPMSPFGPMGPMGPVSPMGPTGPRGPLGPGGDSGGGRPPFPGGDSGGGRPPFPGGDSGGGRPPFPGGDSGGGPMFPGAGSGTGGSNLPRSSAEEAIAANLVEIGVYGILTLYEKYQKEAPKDGTPAPMTPMGMPMTPMATPMTPMATPMTPVDPKAPMTPVDPKAPMTPMGTPMTPVDPKAPVTPPKQ